MLTRRIRLQVVAFVVVALTAVAFVGANHAGIGRLVGGGYVVRLHLAEGGGIFTNSEVTHRGVAVGQVGELRLTADGIEVDLHIDGDAEPIPSNLRAVVANRSAVGEQYVDLQPRTADGPFLTDGAVIPRESTALPLPVSTLLGNLSAFSTSVPGESLRTVVDELYEATRGTGEDLQVLLDSASSFTRTAAEHLPQTSLLITDGATVLGTQLESSQAWRSFAENARLFAAELAGADGDLRRLIGTAPRAATELSALLAETDPSLSVLVANLLTTANVFELRTAGMEQLFVVLPRAVAATSTAITPDGASLAQSLTFFDPLPCVAGYDGTAYRPSTDVTTRPPNTQAGCALPADDPRAVRGSRNAPHHGVPPAAVPGSRAVAGPLGLTALPRVSTTLEELLWLK
jgi:phospholipid/cholesterol/gamma-HCH transport system substrate-binding protein